MANYNIDVKAKVNVQQIKNSIKESLNSTQISVSPKFKLNVDDKNIQTFKNTIANYFQNEKEAIPIKISAPNQENITEVIQAINKKFVITPTIKSNKDTAKDIEADINALFENIVKFKNESKNIPINFAIDIDNYNNLFKAIDNIQNKEKEISNVDVKFKVAGEGQDDVLKAFGSVASLIKIINENNAKIGFTAPANENLSSIKTNIEEYFQNNPIILTISQDINDVDLGSIASKVQELLQLQNEETSKQTKEQLEDELIEFQKLQEEKERAVLDANNALQIAYDKRMASRREREDKEKEDAKEYEQALSAVIKEENANRINNEKTYFDEKKKEYEELANKAKETAQETANIEAEIQSEKDRILTEGLQEAKASYVEELLEQKRVDNERIEATEQRIQRETELANKKMQEIRNVDKELANEQLNIDKQTYDEREILALQYSDKLKEISEQTKNDIDNNAKKAEIVEVYTQQITQIVNSFREGFINIEQAEDQIWEKMSEAKKDGIIPQEVFDNTKQLLNNLEEEAEKSFDAWREKQSKLYDDLQAKTDKQKEYDEKIWEDKAKSVQDMYDKQQISAEEYISRINTLLPEAYEKGYQGAEKYAEAVNKIEKEQDETAESAENLNKSFDNMFNSLMRYFGVTKIFDAIQGSFSKMITEVKNLDVELTEFSKVTDLTVQETEQFIDNSYRLGETVAKTGTEVVTATTLFKKMGYTVDESMDFAKDALMWTNVADGMVSVEEAANMLISTMKAYGEEAVSTTQIIDALNEVSNNYSTSSSALSNNLSTVAATLATSGTDLYQTIGLMTAGIEVMPDKASKVANGLKTISQRIRQIDGDTADKLDDFLGSKGISRYDKLTGQLKGTYDILEEISKLWNDLSVNERQYIGEVMAGKNQITVLNAVMTNFATAINATETAMNSAGSAAEENKRVLESIQGHIQAFKSAFSELSRDFIDSGLFKDIVDFGTSIIKWLDNLIKNYKPEIIDALGAIGAAIVGMQLTNAVTHVVQLAQAFGALGTAGLGAAAGIGIVAAVVIDFLQKTREANEEFENFVELGSKGLPTKAPELEKSIKRYEELYDLLQKETDNKKRKQYAEELGQIQTELKYIGIDVDLVNGKYNDQLTTLKEILSIQREIDLNSKKQSFQESSSEDVVRNIVKDNEHAFGLDNAFLFNTPDAYVKRLQESIDTIYNLNIGGETLKAVLDDNEKSIQEKQKALENAYREYQDKAVWFHGQAETASNEETKIFYEGQEEQMQAYAGIIYQILNSLEEQNKKYGEVVDAASVVVKDKLEKWGFDLSKLTEEQLSSLKEAIESEDVWAIDIPLDELGLSLEQLKSILNDPELKEGFLKLITDEELKQKIEALADTSEDANETIATSLSGAIAMLGDYASQAEILAQAQEDITNSGVITAETLKKIADAGLEAYLTIDEETGSLVVNTQAFFDNNASIEDAAIARFIAGEQAKAESDILGILNGNLDLNSGANANSTSSTQDLGDAAVDTALKLSKETEELIAQKIATNELTEAQANAIQTVKDNYAQSVETGIAAIRSYYSNVTQARTATSRGASHSGNSGSSSKSSSSTSDREAQQAQREAEQAAKNAQKAWKDAFEIEYKKLKTYLDAELITNEEYYDALEELNKHFFEGRAEFEEEYWKYQDEIIKGRKKYLEDELKDYFSKGEKILKHQLNVEYITEEEYYDALTLLYETYYTDKEKYEEEYWKLEEDIYKLRKKQIKELEDELSDLYKEIEDLHKNYIKSLEEDNKELETVIGYAVDVLDEEIEKLKAEKTALSEANEALEEQIKLQELEDALEKAKQKKIRVYRKGQGFVYEQDTKAVGEAQSAIDEYKKELAHKKQLSMIDEEIAKLEEYKKAWKDITESYKRSQNEMTAAGVLGENAREKILAREYNAVGLVGTQYESVRVRIEAANNATIEDLEDYIGDEATAGTFSYEIKRIKDKINEIQSKTVTLQVNTSNSVSNIQNVIDSINSLKSKLEQGYSTNNLDTWLASWKSTIDSAYQYSQQHGITPSTGGGSGSGSGGSGSSGGFNVGDKVKFKDGLTNIPGTNNTIANAFWYNNGNYALDVIEIKSDGTLRIGQNGTIWYDVSPNDLVYSSGSSSGGSGSSGGGDSGSSSGGGEYTEPVYGSNGQIIGYNHYSGDGTLLWYEAAHAQGTLGTTTKTFLVNEEGMEAMVTPEGTVISAPSTGYGVIKNEYTERLTDFAADPMSFLSKTFSGYTGTYQNNPSTNEVININGNLNLPNVTDGQSFVDSIRNVALQYTTRRR